MHPNIQMHEAILARRNSMLAKARDIHKNVCVAVLLCTCSWLCGSLNSILGAPHCPDCMPSTQSTTLSCPAYLMLPCIRSTSHSSKSQSLPHCPISAVPPVPALPTLPLTLAY